MKPRQPVLSHLIHIDQVEEDTVPIPAVKIRQMREVSFFLYRSAFPFAERRFFVWEILHGWNMKVENLREFEKVVE